MNRVLFIVFVLSAMPFSGFVSAQSIEIPELRSPVTDLSGLLSDPQIRTLETTLINFETQNGGQIALLILPGTGDETIEEFGIRLAEEWQIGREDADDGLILIVAKDDRKVRLEVGYGIEHLIPDVLAARIIDEEILPKFRNGDFYGGISDGLTKCMAYLDGHLVYEPEKSDIESVTDAQREKLQTAPGIILLFALILLAFAFFVITWKSYFSYIIYTVLSIIVFVASYFYLEQNPVIVSMIRYLGFYGIAPVLIIKTAWELLVLTGVVKRSKTRPISYSSTSRSSSGFSYSNLGSTYSSSGSSYSSGSSSGSSRFKGGGGSFGGGGASGSW